MPLLELVYHMGKITGRKGESILGDMESYLPTKPLFLKLHIFRVLLKKV